jgi:putative SOS response-associated peptidase YedK
MRWGLIPEWSKNDSFASKMINARIETITTKPSYRDLIYKNRCMVISDGYYEWKQNSDHKTPYFIRHDDGNLLLLAGLWTIWQSPSKPMLTYTIVTTEAQKDIAHIHRRMPLILDHSNMDEWINVENDDFNIKDHAIPSKLNLDHYPVSSLVNSSSNNSKRCITPLKVSDDLNLFGDE